jgi:hypothetical protein
MISGRHIDRRSWRMNRAAVGLAELGVSTIDAVVSLLVFVVVAT